MSPTLDAVVHDAAEVFVGPTERVEDGVPVIEGGALAIEDGRVAAVGPTEEVVRSYPPENAVERVDASGMTVLPGFVDGHTHALFAGDRSDEFAAKLRGATYAEILARGGGILRTVRAVREASDEALLRGMLGRLDTVLSTGTTTLEVKSGYGLDRETELRMLDVLSMADERHPVDVVSTFMGAHAVPAGVETDEYVVQVIEEQLPAVAEQGVAEFCDVFCEEGVFTVEQSRRVLEAGIEHGLTPKVHAEELTHLGGAGLAADLGAASADHLLHATDADARALAEAGTTAVLLPGTAFSLGVDYADPASFEAAGATVAVATDFNPNCYAPSMPFAVTLACVGMGMAPDGAISAATCGGAAALDREDRGTLREGRLGDCVVVDAPSHVHVPYRFGDTPVEAVLKEGTVVGGRAGVTARG